MLQLRHAVPTETALRAIEIERVHRIIDDPIAEGPVLEHLRLRIWVALDTVIVTSWIFDAVGRSPTGTQVLLLLKGRQMTDRGQSSNHERHDPRRKQ